MMPNDPLFFLASKVGEALLKKHWKITLAESCTGGKLAASITEVPGSSAWFERAYITYSNQAKSDMLGVDATVLDQFGAVSEPVARAMAEGALREGGADLAVAITGIAGPGGGSDEKPVGLVWIAWCCKNLGTQAKAYHLIGNRGAIRTQAVRHALEGIINLGE